MHARKQQMNTLFVMLRLGEASSGVAACDRADGFFAQPQKDRQVNVAH